MLSREQQEFLDARRVAHLATADGRGAPHVLPVCFAVAGSDAYITIDDKPKPAGAPLLKRLRNIAENPAVALVADRWDDADWSRLGWVMVRGRADILTAGAEHDAAQRLLVARYAQYRAMDLGRIR
jgi:PPOX class probable F420-dependent enzyme